MKKAVATLTVIAAVSVMIWLYNATTKQQYETCLKIRSQAHTDTHQAHLKCEEMNRP